MSAASFSQIVIWTNSSTFLPSFRKLTRRHSEDQEAPKREKDKKGKQPVARVMSVQPDPKKGGFFKTKVSDKPVETTLEKFGKVRLFFLFSLSISVPNLILPSSLPHLIPL